MIQWLMAGTHTFGTQTVCAHFHARGLSGFFAAVTAG